MGELWGFQELGGLEEDLVKGAAAETEFNEEESFSGRWVPRAGRAAVASICTWKQSLGCLP